MPVHKKSYQFILEFISLLREDLPAVLWYYGPNLSSNPYFFFFLNSHHNLYGQRAGPPLAARPWNLVHIIVIPYTWLSLLEFLILIGLLNKPGNFNTYAQFWKRSQRHLAWIKITSYVEGRYVGLLGRSLLWRMPRRENVIMVTNGVRIVVTAGHLRIMVTTEGV